jgi:saccharopine dehydrogenase-like NADP-dependent oxidoreductase
VYVYAVVEGWRNGQLAREEFYRAYHPRLIDGQSWRAISWTTAGSIAAVVEMVASGTLSQQGFLKQEMIPFDAFLQTENGGFFL